MSLQSWLANQGFNSLAVGRAFKSRSVIFCRGWGKWQIYLMWKKAIEPTAAAIGPHTTMSRSTVAQWSFAHWVCNVFYVQACCSKSEILLTSSLPVDKMMSLKAGQIQHRITPSSQELQSRTGSAGGKEPHQPPRLPRLMRSFTSCSCVVLEYFLQWRV